MLRLAKRVCVRYPILRLYLDDIREIEAIMAELSFEVHIKVDGYALDAVSEMGDLGKEQVSNMSLTVQAPNLSVDLCEDRASVYIEDGDSSLLRGASSRIDAVLRRHQSPSRWLAGTWAVMFSWLPMLLAPWLVPARYMLVAFPAAIALAAAVSTWGSWTDTKRHCIVFVRKRSEHQSFVKRNQDSLVLLVIGAALGVVGTIVANALARKP